MNTLLVWLVISIPPGTIGGAVTYSPPLHDLESCQRVQSSIPKLNGYWRAQCVQVIVPATGVNSFPRVNTVPGR